MVTANSATVSPGPVFVNLVFVLSWELLGVELLEVGLEPVLVEGAVVGFEDVLGDGVELLF